MTHYLMLAAWSQNERLAGRAGIDLPPPDGDWLQDCMAFAMQQAEDTT